MVATSVRGFLWSAAASFVVVAVCQWARVSFAAERVPRPSRPAAVVDKASTGAQGDAVPFPGLIPQPRQIAGVRRWQIITVRPRGRFQCFDVAPDGKQVAYPEDSILHVCSANGRLLHALAGHRDRIRGVAWSPDGQKIATASSDHTARIWKLNGTLIAELRGHDDAVADVAWSRDGKRLATGGDEGAVRIWTAEGKPGAVIRMGDTPITCVALNPEGTRVACGDQDRLVRISNSDGGRIATCKGHFGRIRSLDWSGDGRFLASADQGFSDWEDQPKSLASVRIWDASGQLLRTLPLQEMEVSSIRWSPDASLLATMSADQRVKIWSAAGELVDDLPGDKEGFVRWAGDNQNLFVCGRELILSEKRSSPGVSQLAKGTERDNPRTSALGSHDAARIGAFERAAWNRSGTLLAAVSRETRLRVFEGTGRQVIASVDGRNVRGARMDVGWSIDGKEIAVCGGSVFWMADAKGQLLREIKMEPHHMRMAWSPDGEIIAAQSWGNWLQIATPAGKVGKSWQAHRLNVQSLAWSPDSKRFASGSVDSIIRIWARDGTPGPSIKCFEGAVESLCWSPDGNWIAAGMQNGTWRLWKPDGTEGPEFPGHAAHVMGIAFRPDGEVATCGWEGTVRLWSAKGEPRATLAGHAGPVMSVAWNPDEKHLVSASLDGTVRIWNVESGQTETVILAMTDGTTAIFSGSGDLIAGNAKSLDEDLRYIVERTGGASELLTYSQFRALAAAQTKP